MLRPVPSRPQGPVDPTEATRHVAAELPALDEAAVAALALVALAGRTRAEAAEQAALTKPELADALARGRKALRRALAPLAGSGWCERAERMISDRFDDALEDPGPARLEAHLSNCDRCVEHERYLAQAEDGLVAGFVAAHPARAKAAPESAGEPPALRVIEPEPPTEGRAVRWGAVALLAVLLAVAAIVLALAGVFG